MNNQNFEKFKKDFKRDVLVEAIAGLKYSRFDEDRASELAQKILGVFDQDSAQEVFKSINKLAETHPEVLDTFIKRGTEFDVCEKNERLAEIHLYLSQREETN